MNRISVIIPVYNVFNYLEKCVFSVINQTYKDLEIILIDDGSTDGSGELCDRIRDKDSRISVVHQKNQGLSVARNTGLDIAHGEWIAFLDSDDWIQPEMYEELLNAANDYGVDISSCAMHRCESEDTLIPITDNSITVFEEEDIIEGLISNEVMLFEVWNKLWKKTLIGDVRFIPRQVSEDVYFDRILFSKAKKIVHINKVMHNYRVNRPGNTNSTFKINRLSIFNEFDKWYDDLIAQKKDVLAVMIATISSQFAVHIFEETIEKKQPINVKKRLIDEYKKNYKKARKGHYFFGPYRIKTKVMSISPKLYSALWTIYSKR